MRCWEYCNYPENVRLSCKAYKNHNDKECWIISGTLCKGGMIDKETIEEKLSECTKCDYYINFLKQRNKDEKNEA